MKPFTTLSLLMTRGMRDLKTGGSEIEHLEAVKSLKSENSRLKNEISDLRIVVESATVGLQEEKVQNNTKDCIIEELNEKVLWIPEAKMRMTSENDKSIEDLELCKIMEIFWL